jgi:hypothetical protein
LGLNQDGILIIACEFQTTPSAHLIGAILWMDGHLDDNPLAFAAELSVRQADGFGSGGRAIVVALDTSMR